MTRSLVVFFSVISILLLSCETTKKTIPLAVKYIEKGKLSKSDKENIVSILTDVLTKEIERNKTPGKGEESKPQSSSTAPEKNSSRRKTNKGGNYKAREIKADKYLYKRYNYTECKANSPFISVYLFDQCFNFLEGEVPLDPKKKFYTLNDLDVESLSYIVKYALLNRKKLIANDKLLFNLAKYNYSIYLSLKKELVKLRSKLYLPTESVLELPSDADFSISYKEFRSLIDKGVYKAKDDEIKPINTAREISQPSSSPFQVDKSDISYNPLSNDIPKKPKQAVNIENIKP